MNHFAVHLKHSIGNQLCFNKMRDQKKNKKKQCVVHSKHSIFLVASVVIMGSNSSNII